MKATLTEVIDIGMQVNYKDSTELVDQCLLKFTNKKGEEYLTYPLTKTTHASSTLGKFIRTLLGRKIDKDDYTDDCFDSDLLLQKTCRLEISPGDKVKGITEARR